MLSIPKMQGQIIFPFGPSFKSPFAPPLLIIIEMRVEMLSGPVFRQACGVCSPETHGCGQSLRLSFARGLKAARKDTPYDPAYSVLREKRT